MPINIFTTIDGPSASLTRAFGINDAGQIVGEFRDASNRAHGFLLSGRSFIPIDDPAATGPGSGTFGRGINDARQIVGLSSDARSSHATGRSTRVVVTTLDDPSADRSTQAFGINDAGQIVGEYLGADGSGHGFLLSGGTFFTIDDPLGVTGATSVNHMGQIVGDYVSADHHLHGFLMVTASNPPPPPGTTADMILR